MTDMNIYENRKRSLSDVATRQQLQASDPKRSVWVEASAGTGKTKVLTDRVLRLFLDNVRPDQILCLTYTKAAAVEMNERISARLSKWAVMPYRDESADTDLYRELKAVTAREPDEDLVQRARTLFASGLDIPGGIKIQTIHAFCQEILKRFPLEAGIPPYFSIMDDRMAREILENVSRDLIIGIDTDPQSSVAEAMLYLTQHLGEKAFSDMMTIVINNRADILRLSESFGSIDAFEDSLRQKLNLYENQTQEETLAKFVQSLDRTRVKTMADTFSKGSMTNQKTAQTLYSVLENTVAFDFEEYKAVYLTEKNTVRAVAKTLTKNCPMIEEWFTAEADRILEAADIFKKISLFESTCAVMRVATDLTTRYTDYKRKNARLDYEDLIGKTRELFENKEVADWILFKLDSAINHILIDEAQDTSPDQWAIIRALSADFFAGDSGKTAVRTVFAVGDRKQSIYSFQGADPVKFDEMSRYFAGKTDNFSKVRLDVSFRSTEAVLETVNRLFALPEAHSGVVIDNEAVAHLPFRIGQAGSVEIWPLIKDESSNKKGDDDPASRDEVKADQRLARKIALYIKQTVENHTILESQNRPIRYGDFMVLIQRRNAFAHMFIRECKNTGVQVAGLDKIRLLDQIGVEDLISLCHFLLLPEDDLSLAEVLKSPLFGLTDDDLIKLCCPRSGALWQSLKGNEAYAQVTQVLDNLLAKVDFIRPFELFNEVLTVYGGRQKMAERLGAEVEDALDELLNLALRFEQEHIPDLQSFMQWLGLDNVEIKREQEQSDTDQVRVMTVHGSKGLQAPIVILPDTTRVKKQKRDKTLLWDDSHMAYFPLGKDSYDDICEGILESNQAKALDEYRRLLYVALTRAEDKLCICGYSKNGKLEDNSWYALCQKTLEEIGVSAENGCMTFTSDQVVEPKKIQGADDQKAEVADPEWLKKEALEEAPLSKPYRPSHMEDEDDTPADSPLLGEGKAFKRGVLIHRILQSLSRPSSREQTAEYIHLYLKVNASELTESARRQIEDEILKMYDDPQLEFLFGPDSFAEVPVAGEADGRLISGQIDRLWVGSKTVRIIDFKTNRPAAQTPESVPETYRRQLKCYQNLIKQIYPDKDVETYILWTNTLNLMQIA